MLEKGEDLRIVVDLQACQSGSKFGGIGRYTQNLVSALLRQCKNHEIIFVLNDIFLDSIPNVYSLLADVDRKNIRIFQVPSPINYNDKDNHFRNSVAEVLYENFIFSLKPDIFFISSLVEGLGDNVITSIGKLGYQNITCTIMYDLIPLVEKEKYLKDNITSQHYMRKMADFKKAASLLSISEFSKQQAIDLLSINQDSVTNISSAVDGKFKPIKYDDDYLKTIFLKYGINRKFFLYTASFDQRKNHFRLIEAFSMLPANVKKDYQLVIVGNGWNGIYEHFRSVAKNFGLKECDIIFAGYMTDEELLVIYNSAFLFVFASLSEGFGLPALEAMSCGIPTIGSNRTSIPEVIGEERALFDPFDSKSISNKILEVIEDEDFRKTLSLHALDFSKKFSWDASAKRSIEAFETLYKKINGTQDLSSKTLYDKTVYALCKISRNAQSSEQIAQIASAIEANKKAAVFHKENKIGWVTTFNTRCGIAMYSKYLMGSHINEYSIFAPKDTNLTAMDDKNVFRVFNVGVDDLKELYEQIIKQKIQTLVIQFNYGFFDFKYFDKFVRELASIGTRIFITLHSTDDTGEKKLSEISNALMMAQKVIVHSKNDIGVLKKIGIYKNVELFPQGIVDIEPVKNKTIFSDKRFILASYGFMLPHKGFLELVEAFSIFLKKEPNAHLLMLNSLYPADVSRNLLDNINEKINLYNIKDKVTIISNFLDDEDSIAYLKNADLIIFPYQKTGESSSAAVRMAVSAERPIMVTPLKIFDDISDFAFSVEGTSSKELASSIEEFAYDLKNNEGRIKQNLQKSKLYKEENSYSKLSEKFYKILRI